MIKQVSLPCGLSKDGKLIYIEDAVRGLKCECICPACKQPLIAKNGGKKNAHHFAHLNVVECEHGYQSALHYMAKDLFQEIQYFTFIKNGKPIQYKIDSVELECKVDKIIPDILVTCDGKRFIVEIFVTHAVDDAKKQKIQELKISTEEIDLSRFQHEMITKDLLKQELINPENFSWVYDADVDYIREKKEVIEQFGIKREIQIGSAVGCPLLNSVKHEFAHFVPLEYCIHCTHCYWNKKTTYINCSHTLPAPVSLETRRKLFIDVFVNDNIVMFSSEFQKYQGTFKSNLEKAMKLQYYRLQNIALSSISVPTFGYSTPAPRQSKNQSRHYYYHHKKRK